ncbi:MAG: lysoplasmalogenase family protein, partial [Anaerolineales bacterium]
MSWLFIIAGLFAVLNWYAVAVSNKQIEYFAKPATLITLLVAYVLQLASPPQWWAIVFGLGLLFSLGGDIFLMLPKDQFIKGL